MKIRSSLVAVLFLVGLVPLAGFSWFTYERMVEREFADVKDRHLLLARNLSSSLSKYERDVRTTVRTVARSLIEGDVSKDIRGLLNSLNIEVVDVLDPQTAQSVNRVQADRRFQTLTHSVRLIAQARDIERDGVMQFTAVSRSYDSYNTMYLVGRVEDHFVIARLNTKHFVMLGRQIAFGEKGHATIVDHKGNALFHPEQKRVHTALNMAHLAPVQRMMAGDTGVERFYSTAFNQDLIAGLTHVQGPGWGVMVPQPVSELYKRALVNLTPLIGGLFAALVLALVLIQLSTRWVARPLENLSLEFAKQSADGVPRPVSPSKSMTRISELSHIADAYNQLASAIQKNAAQMAEKALQDPVTGIGNRAYFSERGAAQISQRIALSKQGILMLIDLDGFKEINDTRGHAIGDEVLRGYAQRLYSTVKQFMDQEFRGVPGAHPIIARLGGDEFAILLPLPSDRDDYAAIGEKLLKRFPRTVNLDGIEIACGTSAGGAIYPIHGTTIETLIRRADVALYTSKANGKQRFTAYSQTHALGSKSEIMASVVKAIERDELVLEYQPKFCLRKHRVTGVEALLRWDHPTIGRVAPNLFLPAVQQTQVMVQLGEWVTRRAILDIQAMEQAGHKLTVAINIGVEHFSQSGFVETLERTCAEHDFNPRRLQVEVTEDVMDASRGIFRETVERLQKLGISIAIDDFGKGFSNLSRLAAIEADVVKLDRSLISEAATNPRVQAVMDGATTMAHALGSRVVAEGVETLEEVRLAQLAGADALQGFYFSKALPLAQLAHWLEKQTQSPQHKQLSGLKKGLSNRAA
ncbi:MAG: EAL domain-containing protein [Pseudomonadota bacterium]